jgi:preprotein translocase subunit SecF
MYLIKPGRYFDFMRMRKLFFLISFVLLGLSTVFLFVPGPKWGTDFKGGTEIQVEFKKPVDASAVRQAVESIEDNGVRQFESAEVVAVPGNTSRYMIRVQEVSSISDEAKHNLSTKLCFVDADMPAECQGEPYPDPNTPDYAAVDVTKLKPSEVKYSPGGDKITLRYEWPSEKVADEIKVEKYKQLVDTVRQRVESAGGVALVGGEKAVELVSERDNKIEVHLKAKGDQLMEGIKAHFGPEVAPDAPISSEWVGPKAGAQLREAALKSMGIAVFFIMAYIVFRFDLRFAPGAIVALAHDVLIALGAMCLFQKEITLATVAAVLTIMGYSLSDTVVVYDRIRENLGKHRGMSFPKLVNLSVSEMLGRTLITNITAAASTAMFLFFGTQVLKDFAFVLLIGITVGTYSSIYIAAPFTELIDRRFFAGAQKPKVKVPRTRGARRADAVV